MIKFFEQFCILGEADVEFWLTYCIVATLAAFSGRFTHYLIGRPAIIEHLGVNGNPSSFECIVGYNNSLLAIVGEGIKILYPYARKYVLTDILIRIPCCHVCLSTWIAIAYYSLFIQDEWQLMMPFVAIPFAINELLDNR